MRMFSTMWVIVSAEPLRRMHTHHWGPLTGIHTSPSQTTMGNAHQAYGLVNTEDNDSAFPLRTTNAAC